MRALNPVISSSHLYIFFRSRGFWRYNFSFVVTAHLFHSFLFGRLATNLDCRINLRRHHNLFNALVCLGSPVIEFVHRPLVIVRLPLRWRFDQMGVHEATRAMCTHKYFLLCEVGISWWDDTNILVSISPWLRILKTVLVHATLDLILLLTKWTI